MTFASISFIWKNVIFKLPRGKHHYLTWAKWIRVTSTHELTAVKLPGSILCYWMAIVNPSSRNSPNTIFKLKIIIFLCPWKYHFSLDMYSKAKTLCYTLKKESKLSSLKVHQRLTDFSLVNTRTGKSEDEIYYLNLGQGRDGALVATTFSYFVFIWWRKAMKWCYRLNLGMMT